MSMSDCPKCWDTPCTCGHMGYTTVYHKRVLSREKEDLKKFPSFRQNLQKELVVLEERIKEIKDLLNEA